MTTLALSYDEIASRLGITTASARRLVQRRRWQKGKGNDGRAVVQVPVEFLGRRGDSRQDSPDGEPHDSRSGSPSDSPTVSDLIARLAAAQAALLDTTCRLGMAEGAVAALHETVAALKAALASSEDRAAQIRDERDRALTREHLRDLRRFWRRLVG